jgi:hypothetical protein
MRVYIDLAPADGGFCLREYPEAPVVGDMLAVTTPRGRKLQLQVVARMWYEDGIVLKVNVAHPKDEFHLSLGI